MSSAKKRRKKKSNPVDTVIKVLIVACAVTALALVGLLVAEVISPDNNDVTENTTVFAGDTDETSGEGYDNSNADEGGQNSEVTTQPSTQETAATTEVTTEETTEATTDETTKADFKPSQGTELLFVEEEDRITIDIDPDSEYWSLVVVNISRQMPSDYVPKLDYVAGTSYQMDYRVAPYYTAMYNAALKDGIKLTPVSGYRSYERQKNNYARRIDICMDEFNLSREDARKKAATIVLPAGTSEHNLGLAMDICSLYTSFSNTKEYDWLVEHAHEYGFINRYTEDKQHITGIIYEPWHWRYVGVEYAEQIKNSGLCLEEWLDRQGIAY